MCDAQNEARKKIALQNGCRPKDVDRNCICPPGQGVNKPREEQDIGPMPTTGHEIPLEGVTVDRPQWTPAQINTYNGQGTATYNEQGGAAYNGQQVNARTEMGDRIEDAPPPYSEPATGLEGLRRPEPAVIRPIRVKHDQT